MQIMSLLYSAMFSILTLQIDPKITLGDILSVIVSVLTLIVLVIYTFATIGLWREAHLQSYLSISPFLLFEIDNKNKLFIKNVGNSTALNVNTESLYISVNDTPERKLFQLIFEGINVLDSKETKELAFKTLVNGRESGADISDHLNPKYQKKCNIELTLSYTNAIGIRYFTKFQTGKDGIKVLKIHRSKLRYRLLFWIKRKSEGQSHRLTPA